VVVVRIGQRRGPHGGVVRRKSRRDVPAAWVALSKILLTHLFFSVVRASALSHLTF